MFGEKFTKATGVTLAAFIAMIVGANWKEFFAGLAGLPAMVQSLSSGMPFGFWSCMLSWALGCGMWSLLYLHPEVCKTKPHNCADLAAVATGIGVNLAQYVADGHGASSSAWLLGLLAGLSAMLCSRIVWSLFATPKEPAK